MKYTQLIGFIAAIALIVICFLPWCTIESIQVTLNGRDGYVNENLNFGKQYISHTFFAVILMILFAINKIWTKRTNIFIAFLNLGWACKNFILFSLCRTGICPTIHPALYLLPGISILIQIMTFLPTLQVKKL